MADTENDTHVPVDTSAGHHQPQNPEPDSPSDVESTESAHLGKDLSHPVKRMYPLLDLITEQGSTGSGLVDKIVIAQQSLQEFINALSPGAYSSITKVNFKILDNLTLKSLGIYGSKEEIVRFLREIQAIDDNTAHELLVPRNEQTAGSSETVLRSGLYVVRPFMSTSEEQVYVVYWPEETTWDDRAASPVQRNRETFMRYLSKLCDQLVCLLSSVHSRAIVWGGNDGGADTDDDDDDSDGASTDSEKADTSRFYRFEVAKTKDQEENVVVRAGFTMFSSLIVNQTTPPKAGIKPREFRPALLHGEKVQGFMTATFVPARTVVEPFTHDNQTADQVRLRLVKEVALCLPEKFDSASLKSLVTELGLRTRFRKEYETWEKSKNEIGPRFQQIVSKRKAEMHTKIEQDLEGMRVKVRRALVCELLTTFPSLRRERFLPESRPADPGDASGDSNEEHFFRDIFLKFPRLEQQTWGKTRGADLGKCLTASEFQFKKKRMIFLQLLDKGPHAAKGLTADLAPSVRDAVLSQTDEKGILVTLEKFRKEDKGVRVRMPSFLKSSSGEEGLWESAKGRASSISDSQFLLELKTIPDDHYLHDVAIELERTAYDILTKHIDTSVSAIGRQILSTQKQESDKQVQREAESKEAQQVQTLWSKFVRQVKRISTQRFTSRTTLYLDNFKVRKSSLGRETFDISGREESLREDEIEYRIHLIRLHEDESQKVQLDSSYIPTPILGEERLTPSFRVPSSAVVEYAHLLEGGRILLCLVDPNGNMVIYVESLNRINSAIQRQSSSRLFSRERIGETCLFAIDESKRLFAVYSSARMQLHTFAFEDDCGSLRGIGPAVDLLPFYNNGESIVHACFVHGREEILFVDSSAHARIFSLTMLQPKPASLKLQQVPCAVYSSPDGSCVLVVQKREGVSTVTAYHWATFASTDGISITLPNFPADLDTSLLTSIVNRNNIHLIGLDVTSHTCRSVSLYITYKATEFTFQEERSKPSTNRRHGKETAHNCLIDCHSDVWTRFPVVAAVKRRTITSSSERHRKTLTFVTDDDQRPFSSYFSDMIRSFTKTSRKPTGDVLKGITVSAQTFISFARAFLSSPEWPVSRFRAGEWLADLLCLIPIHIAVTNENRFVPLKDGVQSAQLETSLLGAEVSHIVESLSIGWYESIFQSYWASKPVKVVSSMGVQSVGKSFTLNHLVDTSFAGSAMRTTEGVWLSVSPTDDALIVALDFEGVDSLERSPQEDTLLVLFNTAISNLVLFRNNFAIGRDITGLFQSFQSSASILDPTSNPSLFQSTLLVIIKDVIDSDEAEVKKEFSLKFQKIVEDEQDSNFITRLHAGKLNIIPWPVIGSKEFYKTFTRVKKTLDQQQTSHNNAGEFLLTLKTLMAKLKANDWGTMSQNMATQRVNSLLSLLPNALETGFSEIDAETVPLKNFDADAVIEAEDTEARFILTNSDTPVAEQERRLATLCESWDRVNQRQYADDSTWHTDLTQFLTHLVDLRVAHVESWIESNVQRFKGDHASIEELRRTFDNAIIDLRAGVELCRRQCDSCSLVCVRSSRLHVDGHDCLTNHECIHDCTYCERDALPNSPCGESAGHPGDHICQVGVHRCGEQCAHFGKRGCTEKCIQPTGHEDNHICSAPIHMCGQPCRLASLRLPDGKVYRCPGTCRVPIDKGHVDHECENRECPVSCQLCGGKCTGDHFHGLSDGQNHLCGKRHFCGSECSAGVCEIQTKPEAIEATFTGWHDSFQYTKYTQVAKRLPCAKLIMPGEVGHPGPHIHSNDEKPFHYCNSRCGNCGYLCTLPSGHSQQEHETSHGSMSQTRWAIDGSDDTSVVLKDRKFSSNDDGGPMLCNLVCLSMGRHVHVDFCRGPASHNPETQHVDKRISPEPNKDKDWITHALHWRRMGFKDPYSREEQANFSKCDAMCPGTEHAMRGASTQPSSCTLEIFHPPLSARGPPPGPGYVSDDGHHFSCKKPGPLQAAFHVIFAIDTSQSMARSDRQPLPNAPGTQLIAHTANNRFGAVLSSLYSFWMARQAAAMLTGGYRRDAYTVMLFSRDPLICVEHDYTSSPDELLTSCLGYQPSDSENYTRAIRKAQSIMASHWSTERAPVLIFLTDGQSHIEDKPMYEICRDAARHRMPLSFHAVSFGPENRSVVLRRMVEIAREVESSAPQSSLLKSVPSSFSKALNTIHLTATFQGLANSLTKTRGSLLSS